MLNRLSDEECSSQLWTQFMQLRKEPEKKVRDFNGIWIRDVSMPVRRSNQLSYETTNVERWSIMGSYVPVKKIIIIMTVY